MACSVFIRLTLLCGTVFFLTAGTALSSTGSIVYDMSYVSEFGSTGTGNGQFGLVEQVVVGPDNKIYVADRGNSRIQIFDRNGVYLDQFGSAGTGNGQFSSTIGIAFANDGKIIASDLFNNRIQFFDPVTHAYLGQFGTAGTGPGQFDAPAHLATDSDGNIYVADNSNDRINIYDSNGVFIRDFAPVYYPLGLAISDDKIYVPSEEDDLIYVYDRSYNFLGFLATPGSDPGEVIQPTGLTVDKQGNLYVADGGNQRIQIFNKDGTSIVSYYSVDSALGYLDLARSVAVADDGRIYVTDLYIHNVQIFQLLSTETFLNAPPDNADEIAATPLSDLVLNGSGSFTHDFIGYHDVTLSIGDWTLSGNNDFSGDINLLTGALSNTGTLSTGGTMTTATGTTLSGDGTFNGDMENNGLISPGDNNGISIGTMTINGDYTDSASALYRMDVNAAGQHDSIVINGTAILNGGDLQLIDASGVYHVNTSYEILTASGGITGTFDNVTKTLAFLTPQLDYSTPNKVILSMVRNDGVDPFAPSLDFQPYGTNRNRRFAAMAMSNFSISQFGGNSSVFNAVQTFTQSDAEQLLSQISPDEIASAAHGQAVLIRNMQAPIFQRLSTPVSTPSYATDQNSDEQSFAFYSQASSGGFNSNQVWLQSIGAINTQQNNANGANGYRSSNIGMRAGIDNDVTDSTKLGLSIAHARSNTDYKTSDDKNTLQYTHLDIYGQHHIKHSPLVIEGFLGVGGGRMDTTRIINTGGLFFNSTGNTNVYDVSGAVKFSNPIPVSENNIITPNIAFAASWIHQNSFSEKGSSPFNLHIDSVTSTPVTVAPMINWQHPVYSDSGTYAVIPEIGMGTTWQVNELDNHVNARFSNAVGTPGFTSQSSKQSPLSFNVTAALTIQPFETPYLPELVAQASLQAGKDTTNTAASITAKWSW